MNRAALEQLIYQTEIMYQSPDKIAKNWSTFKDNIVSLSSWMQTMQEQPLEIDYIVLGDENYSMPAVKASFFLIASIPLAPSPPMPVSITPMAFLPHCAATESNRTSTEGQ